MNYWDPKYEPSSVPQLIVPELTDDVVKVALANFIQRSCGVPNFSTDNKEFKLVSYETKHADITENSKNLRTYFLKINFQLSKENQHVKLILKLQNQETHDKESTQIRQLFMKEMIFYGCIIPKMRDFLPSNNCELPVPDCYLAKSQDSSLYNAIQSSPCCFLPGTGDILILEDVEREEYRSFDTYFDTAHIKLALKSLAQLHGMSVVLNRRGSSHNLSIAQSFPNLTEETYFNKKMNSKWYEQFLLAIDIFSVIGPLMDEEVLLPGRDLSKVIRVMMRELWDILEDTIKPSASHINALCLTNCDLNSFKFFYDEQKNAKNCKICSFENIKFTRPAIDLVHVLYNCTQIDLQHDSLNYFLQYYHDEFLETIRKSHLKYHPTLPLPSGLLSLAELTETYRECKILGAARRALITSFACLLDYDPYTSFERNANIRFAAEEMISKHPALPPSADLKRKAYQAFKENPHYRVMMYRTMGELIECIAQRISCERVEPHSGCPHPHPKP